MVSYIWKAKLQYKNHVQYINTVLKNPPNKVVMTDTDHSALEKIRSVTHQTDVSI